MKQLLFAAVLGGTAAAQPVMQPGNYDGPPSECPPSQPVPPPAARASTAIADEPGQWLVLGAIGDEHGTLYGGRAQLDVFTHGAWSLGLAGVYRGDATGDAPTRSNATVYLAGTTAIGPLLLRAQLGAGVAFVDAGASQMSIGGASTSTIGEAALLVGLPVAREWLVIGGPVVDADQTGTASVTLFGGLGRRF